MGGKLVIYKNSEGNLLKLKFKGKLTNYKSSRK